MQIINQFTDTRGNCVRINFIESTDWWLVEIRGTNTDFGTIYSTGVEHNLKKIKTNKRKDIALKVFYAAVKLLMSATDTFTISKIITPHKLNQI